MELRNDVILVTGAAGFIGSNLCEKILKNCPNTMVIGVDNMNDYYDVSIKEWRLNNIRKFENFTFFYGDISDRHLIEKIFSSYEIDYVINLAAQAGVRYSIINPDAYIQSNLLGFYNIIECIRHSYDNGKEGVKHFLYASSSSVYGSNKKVPYSTNDKVDNPVSLYAATKKSNELIAHAYSKLYNIPCTGLRFFTVYGPAGRPDMAYFSFTEKLLKGEKIKIFNYGNCKRDFTYIDDIVESVFRLIHLCPKKKNGEDGLPIPPYRVLNIGNSHPEDLMKFVETLIEKLKKYKLIDENFDKKNYMELMPMQPGDVPVTYADTQELEALIDFKPKTSIDDGLDNFVKWYLKYYNRDLSSRKELYINFFK